MREAAPEHDGFPATSPGGPHNELRPRRQAPPLLGLGVFASRPYLARATGWVALFFLLAGGALLAFPTADLARLGLRAGAVFGTGLLAAAVVLHLDLPRERP